MNVKRARARRSASSRISCAAHHDTSLVWFQAQHLEAVRVKEEEEKKRKSRYHTRHSD